VKSRFPFHLLFLALPVIAFCALGGYFLVDKAPKLVNAERAAIARGYRDIAESLVTNGVAATWRGEREKGWRQTSRIDKKTPWGYVVRPEGRILVWIEREDKSVIGLECPSANEHMPLWIYGGFGFAMLFVTLVTVLGIVLLRRRDQEREAFIGAVIHDLRTPLSAIRTLAKSDPQYVSLLADSMLAVVKNAQDFMGFGRGRGEQPTEFDLAGLIRECYRIFEDDFAENESGPVTFAFPESLVVRSEVTVVRQIVWNLFSNAAKYAAPYGAVAVSASAQDGRVTVVFADNGPGMTPRQMRRAFDRYYRAAGLHACGKGGFGIWLYTSRASARRLGGDITVRQNHPKGCVFNLNLPFGFSRKEDAKSAKEDK